MARPISQTEQRDPLLIEIRQELMPGRFVRYDDMFDFGRQLHQVEEKSKYYDAALSHFQHARDLYRKTGLDSDWQAVVDRVYAEHSRKYGFMPAFERLLAGKAESNPSFAEKARARWQRQVSDPPDAGRSQS